MTRYFADCTTTEQLKKAYHEAVKRLYPDKGGNAAEFAAMQNEYEQAAQRVAAEEAGRGYQKHADGTAKSADEIFSEQSQFRTVLDKLIHLDGLQLEICGNWLWVTGNTYEYKDALKEAGLKFAGRKKAWYWHAGEWVRKTKKQFSLDEIRNLHGSEIIKGNALKKLAAGFAPTATKQLALF